MAKEDLSLRLYKGSILDALQAFAMMIDADMFLRCLLKQISLMESIQVVNTDPKEKAEHEGYIAESINSLKETYQRFKQVRDLKAIMTGSTKPDGGVSA